MKILLPMTLNSLKLRFISSVTVILFFICIWNEKTVQAQPGILWAKQMKTTSSGNHRGHAITVDSNGNVFSTGVFTGTVDFDPGAGIFNLISPGYSVFVSKLDASGNFIWAKSLDALTSNDMGMGFGIALDNSGNIFVTGELKGSLDFDPGSGTFNLSSRTSSDLDIFVCKLNPSGDFVWAKGMGDTGSDVGNDLAVDTKGNVIITGVFRRTVDFDPGPGVFNLVSPNTDNVFVCKLDNDGNLVWAKQMGGTTSGSTGYSIVLDQMDNVYTTGQFASSGDYDPGPGTYTLSPAVAGQLNMFISKLDESGNFVWANNTGAISSQTINAGHHYIAIDKQNNVYTIGAFDSTTDFDPGTGVFNMTSVATVTGASDLYVRKSDSAGNFIWAKQFSGLDIKTVTSVALDSAGNVYTTGKFRGTVDFDPSPGGVYNLTVSGSMDVFICKLDSAGNFVCAGRIGGSSANSDMTEAWAIATDSNSNIHVTGNFMGTNDFDPGSGVFNMSAGSFSQIYVGKYNSCINLPVFPEANFRASDSIFCGNKCINFTDLSANATSWEWHFQGASPSSSTDQYPQNICYTAAGAYDVTLIAKNTDGTDTLSKVQYINLNQAVTVSVSVTVTPPMPVCTGTLLNFTAIPVNGGTTPVYQWKVNGTNVGTNSSIFSSATLNNNDVVTCELTSNLGCSGAPVTSTPITLQLSAAPDAGIISAVRDTICEGTPASLSVTGNTTTVQWQTSPTLSGFTDIASAVNTNYIAVLTQSAYFRVYASNGACTDTSAPYEIVVKPSPVAEFSFMVSGKQATFSNQSTGATRYEWNFADGSALSTEENPIHNYSADGTYHVCLTAYNGSNCSFTECRDVVIGSVGIKSISSDASWKVFPNPFTDELLIEGIQLNDEIKSIQIYDLLGRELINKSLEEFQGNTLRIDVSGLAEGMYILKIKTDADYYVQPLVKQ